jgi:hypothetical protein
VFSPFRAQRSGVGKLLKFQQVTYSLHSIEMVMKPFLFLVFIFLTNQLFSQKEPNRPERDDAPYFFGATLGYNTSFLHATKSAYFIQNDSVLYAKTGSSGGVSIGLLGTMRLNKHFQFRFNPQIIIGSARYFNYHLGVIQPGEQANQTKTLPANIVTFPFQLKFQSDRIDNFRVFLLGGIKYDIYFSGNSSDASAKEIQFKPTDFGVEGGIGCSIYFPYFTLSPELKFSDGLTNILSSNTANKFSNVFDKIQTRMITFSLHFEY